jgi:hypothetical protein
LNRSTVDDGGKETDMNTLMTLVAAAMLVGAQHPQMPAGMSHEEHLAQMRKEEALKKRGADAMGFDQDGTTHHFTLTPRGGSIEVSLNDGADRAILTAVRAHLRTIADEFSGGHFDKPFQTHGEVPPGVAAMQANPGAIAFRYQELSDGGVVRIETEDPGLVKAVHAFLRYQITEHRTGDSLEVKR